MTYVLWEIAQCKGDFNGYWPLPGVEKEAFIPPTKEWWDKMKQAQVKVDKKIQDERLKNRNIR